MTAVRYAELARVDWRSLDRIFFAVLLASLIAHFAFVASVMGRASFVALDADDDIPDRWGQIYRQPPKPVSIKKGDANHAPTPTKPKEGLKPFDRTQLQARVAHLGIIGVLDDGKASAFDALSEGERASDLEDALRGATGVREATIDDIGRGDRRGDGTGKEARLDALATEGARNVGIGGAAHAHVRGTVEPEVIQSGPTALDSDAVARYVKSQSRAIQTCYESQLKLFPKLQGKLAMRVTISALGRVAGSDVDEDTLRNDALVGCVQSRLRFWKFPFQLEHEAAAELSWSFVPAG
jgi:hypothetical protein